ncbi:TPA: DUF1983 domain-containing protein [Escherichia coli]|nr:DUF1983 domain-containing protein [Escherichia coli]
MGANGNRKQTLRTNIVQPYESGFLTDVEHKDYNAVIGSELDKVSTATKHMFQGLDDIRKEVDNRTKALDALHLQVNDDLNRVTLEIAGVKESIGQGINMDNITDADGNVLSGVLQGIKTQVNTANGQIMVAVGEISNLDSKFDGQITTVKTKLDDQAQQIIGVETIVGDPKNPGSNTLLKRIATAETTLSVHGNSINSQGATITNQTQAIATINKDGTTAYNTQWGIKSNVNGLVRGVGFAQGNGTSTFTINADSFQFTGGGANNKTIPFQITNGVAYIKSASIGNASITSAMIKDAQITNAKIGGTLSGSSGAGANYKGWALAKDGTFSVNSGTGTNVARVVLDANGLHVYDSANVERIRVGKW